MVFGEYIKFSLYLPTISKIKPNKALYPDLYSKPINPTPVADVSLKRQIQEAFGKAINFYKSSAKNTSNDEFMRPLCGGSSPSSATIFQN